MFSSSSLVKMETTRSSETLIPVYQTTWCHKPEDSNLAYFHLHFKHILLLYKNMKNFMFMLSYWIRDLIGANLS
jgi:hypothetical protein